MDGQVEGNQVYAKNKPIWNQIIVPNKAGKQENGQLLIQEIHDFFASNWFYSIRLIEFWVFDILKCLEYCRV